MGRAASNALAVLGQILGHSPQTLDLDLCKKAMTSGFFPVQFGT